MPKLQHTPTPWYRNIRPITKYPVIYAGDSPNHVYCFSFHVPRGVTPEQAEANVDFLLRACNSHDALVSAAQHALGTLKDCASERRDFTWAEAQSIMLTLGAALKLAKEGN